MKKNKKEITILFVILSILVGLFIFLIFFKKRNEIEEIEHDDNSNNKDDKIKHELNQIVKYFQKTPRKFIHNEYIPIMLEGIINYNDEHTANFRWSVNFINKKFKTNYNPEKYIRYLRGKGKSKKHIDKKNNNKRKNDNSKDYENMENIIVERGSVENEKLPSIFGDIAMRLSRNPRLGTYHHDENCTDVIPSGWKEGDPAPNVYAPFDGTILSYNPNSSGGGGKSLYLVSDEIDNTGKHKWYLWMCHFKKVFKTSGKVKTGDLIAEMGRSGFETSKIESHTHLRIGYFVPAGNTNDGCVSFARLNKLFNIALI